VRWALTESSQIIKTFNKLVFIIARYERFEDLPVWQEAERLYRAVLDLLEGSPNGLSHGFRNQIDRASLSVSNNIAD
jgi:23S rRNA-intervening sequence protein